MNSGPLLPALPEGFGRAAEKLADTVRHVVDIAVGPDRIRAKARAQADSAVIQAEGHAQVVEIEARAIERLRKREARRQQNIESITVKSLSELQSSDNVSEKLVSDDWTSRFFEECQDIGDEQMQRIWARILAGEVVRPGSFAPRTLSVVRDLTKEDADLFANLCRFVWDIPGLGFVPIIPDANLPLLAKLDLHFGILTHLTSMGLIEFTNMTEYRTTQRVNEIAPRYYGGTHLLKHTGDAQYFEIGHAIFTAVGSELARIVSPQGNDECEKGVLEYWSSKGWKEAPEGDRVTEENSRATR